MSYALHNCFKMVFLSGAICLLAGSGRGIAAQKIVFSDPSAPVEAAAGAQAQRDALLKEKSPHLSSFLTPSPNFNGMAPGIPDVLTAKKKDWLSNGESDKNEEMTERQKMLLEAKKSSRFEKDLYRDGLENDPLREADKTRARSALASPAAEPAAQKDSWSRRSELEDRRTREPSESPKDALRDNALERLREMQLSHIEEFKKLYDNPSVTAPVNSPYDSGNSAQETLSNKRPEEPHLADLPNATPAPESFSRAQSAIPSRGPAESPESRSYIQAYREQKKDPNQPDSNGRQPAVLTFPKRPGDLLR